MCRAAFEVECAIGRGSMGAYAYDRTVFRQLLVVDRTVFDVNYARACSVLMTVVTVIFHLIVVQPGVASSDEAKNSSMV